MEYQWTKGHFNRTYKIRRDNKAIEKLSFDSMFNSDATAAIHDQTFKIKKKGFLKTVIAVSTEDSSH